MNNQKKRIINKSHKKVALDFIYTFGSAAILNIALQIVIYPIINHFFDEAVVGDILYFIGIIYIIPQAIGPSICNARLITRRTDETTNGDYTHLLVIGSAISALACAGVHFAKHFDIFAAILYGAFSVVYMLRMYGAVEYRLSGKFSGYFLNSAIVSVGYLVGLGLFFLTGQWILIFAVGEIFAVAHIYIWGNVFKKEKPIGNKKQITKRAVLITTSNVIRDSVTQFDKVVVNQLLGNSATTEYHIFTLIAKTMQLLVAPINVLMLTYLTKKDASLTKKVFTKYVIFGLLFGVGAFIICVIGTPIYINLFFSNFNNNSTEFSLLANSGLVIGFVGSLFLCILMSQGNNKAHATIQGIWGGAYAILAVWLTHQYGLWGVAVTTLVTNTIKLIAVIIVAYVLIDKEEKKKFDKEADDTV